MDSEIIKASENEIEKHKFHQHKNPSKVSVVKNGFKYFIGYEDRQKS